MILRLFACLSTLVLLAACGDDPAPEQQQGGSGAVGEVEGGTISDAMLPLESVTSQSPPRGGGDDEDGDGDSETGEASPADAS